MFQRLNHLDVIRGLMIIWMLVHHCSFCLSSTCIELDIATYAYEGLSLNIISYVPCSLSHNTYTNIYSIREDDEHLYA